jgi:hypothetical protein
MTARAHRDTKPDEWIDVAVRPPCREDDARHRLSMIVGALQVPATAALGYDH